MRRFIVGCVAGVAVSFGPWAVVETVRFGNPVFPCGGRRLNDDLVTQSGRYVDLGASNLSIRSFGEFFGDPVRILRRSTAITEFAVRDLRLFASACCCVLAVLFSARNHQAARRRATAPEVHRPSRLVVLGSAFAAYWLTTYSVWAFLFGNGRYLELLELVTPTMLCITVAAIAASKALDESSNRLLLASSALLVCVAIVTIPFTISPDYGHLPFAQRWYDVDTSALPPLDDAMVIVPYEFEPLDFAEFVLAPRSFARLHVRLLPTRLGQREVARIASFDGPIYSFQFSNAGDANLAEAGLHRTGSCYPAPSKQGFAYSLCELTRNG